MSPQRLRGRWRLARLLFRMAPVSPAADVSFDYQDLLFRPAH